MDEIDNVSASLLIVASLGSVSSPDHHRSYLDHNPENNVKWAATIGPSTEKYVAYILENNVEKKALNILSTLQNISRKYTTDELEKAITTLLEISTTPSNTVLKGILERKRSRQKYKNQQQKHTSFNRKPWFHT